MEVKAGEEVRSGKELGNGVICHGVAPVCSAQCRQNVLVDRKDDKEYCSTLYSRNVNKQVLILAL